MFIDRRAFLPVPELARELRTDPKVIYRAINAGELASCKIPGHPRSTRVRWTDVELWLCVGPVNEPDADEQAVADRLAASGA